MSVKTDELAAVFEARDTAYGRGPYRRIEGATDRRVQRIALSQIRYSSNKAIELSTFKHFFLTGRKVQIKSVTY